MSDRTARVIAFALVFVGGSLMYSAGTIASGMQHVILTSAGNVANTGIWFIVIGALALLTDCLGPLVSQIRGKAKRENREPDSEVR